MRYIVLASLLALASGPSKTAGAEDAADLILTDGRVYTVAKAQPWAEAVAIQGERILAVGTDVEERIDAKVLYTIVARKIVYESP